MVLVGLSAGAEAYLLKEINVEVLAHSIVEIMEENSVQDPAVAPD